MSQSLDILSQIVGWIYFFAWSISFHAQIVLNFKKKSVEGFNMRYCTLNFTGFLMYSMYSSFGYFGNDPGAGTVTIQDLCFAYHAFASVFILEFQGFIYPVWAAFFNCPELYFLKRGNNRIGRSVWTFTAISWTAIFTYLIFDKCAESYQPRKELNPISFMGYVKIVVTLVKYAPQVYWNYIRKTTAGWSTLNTILDFNGGVFSLIQIVIDSCNGTDSTFSGGLNITKFALSIISIVYCIIIMIQRFIIYGKPKNNMETAETMLLKEQRGQITEDSTGMHTPKDFYLEN